METTIATFRSSLPVQALNLGTAPTATTARSALLPQPQLGFNDTTLRGVRWATLSAGPAAVMPHGGVTDNRAAAGSDPQRAAVIEPANRPPQNAAFRSGVASQPPRLLWAFCLSAMVVASVVAWLPQRHTEPTRPTEATEPTEFTETTGPHIRHNVAAVAETPPTPSMSSRSAAQESTVGVALAATPSAMVDVVSGAAAERDAALESALPPATATRGQDVAPASKAVEMALTQAERPLVNPRSMAMLGSSSAPSNPPFRAPYQAQSKTTTAPPDAPAPAQPTRAEAAESSVTLSARDSPFLMGTVDMQRAARRVQLAPSGTDSGAIATPWFSVGEQPAPGWTVIGIEPHSVTLLSPGHRIVQVLR